MWILHHFWVWGGGMKASTVTPPEKVRVQSTFALVKDQYSHPSIDDEGRSAPTKSLSASRDGRKVLKTVIVLGVALGLLTWGLQPQIKLPQFPVDLVGSLHLCSHLAWFRGILQKPVPWWIFPIPFSCRRPSRQTRSRCVHIAIFLEQVLVVCF